MMSRIKILFLLASLHRTSAQHFNKIQFESCLDPSTAAPSNQQLNVTNFYAQFAQGQTSQGELAGGFSWDDFNPPVYSQNGSRLTGAGGKAMRLIMEAEVGGVNNPGFSNLTNLLQTIVVSSEIVTFEVGMTNSSSLCSSIRNQNQNSMTTTRGGSGCPYGGNIAVGITVPLTSSYQLTTVSTNIVVLDASSPALTLACYNVSFTPYYPSYFAYSIIHYFAIALLATFLFVYVIARLYAASTHVNHENEARLASSLTLKISGQNSRRYRWGKVWYSAFAGTQVVREGSLRRFATPEFSAFQLHLSC
jgi:hypothetical protein